MFYKVVRQAVLQKKAIYAQYDGEYLEMCPHIIGTKSGREQALCYQYGGESTGRTIEPDGSPRNWRAIDIAKLTDVVIADSDEWHTAPARTRPLTCIDVIDEDVP